MNTTMQANTETIFVNLFKAIKAEKAEQLRKFTDELSAQTDINAILGSWYYKELLPASKKYFVWELSDLKNYLIERKKKVINKELQKKLTHLQTVQAANDLHSIVISIEWKKSRMWGNNPTAEAKVSNTDGMCNYYSSGSIGGCGYDKESTAVAQAINQSNELLKALYLVKEKHIKKDNRELFGYGSGYGILPHFEGGVGVSCYNRICEKIGFKFNHSASGKTFDVYAIEK